MSSIDHVKSLTLDLPPSCIELWPWNTQYAVIGTYNLEKSEEKSDGDVEIVEEHEGEEKKSQQRSGSLVMVRIEGDDVGIVQTLSTPSAIFDLHFFPGKASIMAIATSTGTIELYRMLDKNGKAIDQCPDSSVIPTLVELRSIRVCPEDVMVTSFLWLPIGTTVVVTLSTGEVELRKIPFDEDQNSTLEVTLGTHSLEAWTAAFLPDVSAIYSGGDDSTLICYGFSDTTSEGSGGSFETNWIEGNRTVLWSDRKTHGAGVTAILPLPTNSDQILLLTGSYDDHIRLISAPSFGRRSILAEGNLGGGVWRLKLLQCNQNFTDILILASCMYAGARIVKLFQDAKSEWHFEVVAKFEEHKSMNYASECLPEINEKGHRTFITTSFYDRLLCLWRF
ncbi:hypothetical protein B0J11DRAFT_423585 [Dendryphion nanum]|uniref:methylated diphthine methylhydrolase n=1 Tax=Dendryphion nanum TaxID=256645 RepID=A0A9P9EJ66_9PLEO|nr:hypothetical protein B0J11DRAFT_423585 [Dendryphion nanum]